MAIYLARFCGASVTGVTLSQTQLGVARSGAAELGLTGATDFRFCDYRKLDGRFDRIVSVGMFEHVGLAHYDLFFRKVGALLDEDGIALIHTIGRADGPWPTNPWVTKYIFPGGYMAALSEIMPSIERSGLFVTDIEILRIHYAETLKAWRGRLQARRAEIEARRACGSSILPAPNARSGARDSSFSRSSSPKSSKRCPTSETILAASRHPCVSAMPPGRICGWRANKT
jgi:cyclopropane-fatty-acyl-phospholipid synthase